MSKSKKQIETKTVRQIKFTEFDGRTKLLADSVYNPVTEKKGTSEATMRNMHGRDCALLANGDWIVLSKQSIIIRG